MQRQDQNEMTRGPLRSIVLIGMPCSGKSTVGVILAKDIGWDFVDTDVLLQIQDGRILSRIVEEEGYLALRRIEERMLLDLNLDRHVIATGGSAVYSEEAMVHLKSFCFVVYLDVTLNEIRYRSPDLKARGIASPPGHTLLDIFRERRPLYRRYADVFIDCGQLRQEQVAARVRESCLLRFPDLKSRVGSET